MGPVLAAVAAVLVLGGLAYYFFGRDSALLPQGAATAPSSQSSTAVPAAPGVAVDGLLKPGPLPENVLGKPDAKVTIVEYASLTCPHCAHFHTDVLPKLKSTYIDTGKARLVYREFARDNLDAAAYLLARCVDPSKYFGFIGLLFEKQEQWAFVDGDPRPQLKALAKQAGLTDAAFDTCIADKEKLKKLAEIRDRADKDFGVDSTPTVFVNGVKIEDGYDFETIAKAIDPLLK